MPPEAAVHVGAASPARAAARPALLRHGLARDLREAHVRLALRLFGPAARKAAARQPKLRFALEQAHLPHLPESFVALTWLNALLVLLGGYALATLGFALAASLGRPPQGAVLAVVLAAPAMLASCAFVAQSVWPDYQAGERRRRIDRDLPYAVNYVAAMSSAGVVPAELLRDLAREPTYGEVSREAAWMVRDIDLLGVDLLGALGRAAARSPSRRWAEFLQGAKTAILSGGDLKAYFGAKAEQYMAENRRVQREFLDSLGVLAESYVTVVIAGPLFMLVMLSIMLVIGNASASTETFLFLLVFLVLPVTHAAFSWMVKNMAPEA